MVNNKISSNIVDGLEEKIVSATIDKKKIGYEGSRNVTCSGNVTVSLQDSDEIVGLVINDNANITFNTSSLTFPKSFFTIQALFVFPNGAKTVQIANAGKKYINGIVPDFSGAKNHWVVFRFTKGIEWVLISDAGVEM